MELLTNMPMWARILSMGSFMFASGVLITRLPLVPVLILSFFYLYGTFGDKIAMPTFTLAHPWWWILAHFVIILLLALLFFYFCNSHNRSINKELASFFILVWITMGILVVYMLLSEITAFTKLIKLLSTISLPPTQTALWITLFTVGILVGLLSLGFLNLRSISFELSHLEYLLPRFFFTACTASIVCGCSLSCISIGMKNFTGALVVLISILGSFLLFYNATTRIKYHYLRSDKQQQLLQAVEEGNLEKTKQLLSQGSSANARDLYTEWTPLLEASSTGQLEIVQVLLKAGAHVNDVKTGEGTSPLYIACEHGNLSIVQELIKSGADVNMKVYGRSPLVEAISSEYWDIVNTLLEAGADVNATISYPYHPALTEASWRNVELVKQLLQKGANVNAVDSYGKTALQYVLGREDSEEAARIIYAAGGRLGKFSLDDPDINSMMDHACANGFTEVEDQLLNAGLKPTPRRTI